MPRTPCSNCGGATCCADAIRCHACAAVTYTTEVCGAIGCEGVPRPIWRMLEALEEQLEAAEERVLVLCARERSALEALPLPEMTKAMIRRALWGESGTVEP